MVTMVPDQHGQFQSVTNKIMNFFLDSKLFILYHIYWVFIVYDFIYCTWFFLWSCMDLRRRLSAEELMLLNCGVGEDS